MSPADVVDLTQELGPRTLLWPGSPRFETEVLSEVDSDGSFARAVSMPEHIGTHLDAPIHFVPGSTAVDEIPPERLVVDACVVDVRADADQDPDYTLEAPTIEEFEAAEGPIAAGSALIMRTGWDRRRTDPESYYGGLTVEEHHFPGFGRSAAELLVDRGVVGLGTDAASIDAGSSPGFPVHSLTMAAGLWHLEGLQNLAALPPRGALLFVGVLPIDAGSGAPARVLALLSDNSGGSYG
jgi:kynurenine formamidase